MARRFLVSMDSEEMDWRFSTEDKRLSDHAGKVDFGHSLEEVQPILNRLPPREADMIRMYFFQKKEQKDIGKIFNVSQGDVFYRLNRAIERIKFILELPAITKETMVAELGPILEGDPYLEIMWILYETTSQTEVARRVGSTQGKVRYRFLKSLKRVEEAAEVDPAKYSKYVQAYKMIMKSFNALRELTTQVRWSDKFEGEKR